MKSIIFIIIFDKVNINRLSSSACLISLIALISSTNYNYHFLSCGKLRFRVL